MPSLMTEAKALEIVQGILRDRKQWGESAGIRVAEYELVNALLVLESRFGDIVTKDELTFVKRQLTAALAQKARLVKGYKGETKDDHEG